MPATSGRNATVALGPACVAHRDRTGSHRQRQLLQTTRDPAWAPAGTLRAQFDGGEPAQQRRDRDVGLEPGERRPEAEVDALAERQVPVVGAADVELVRV